MLCSNCGKREVEVLIKQVINQEVHNLNLCRACAEELGFIAPDIPSITISFSLNETDTQKQRKVRRLPHGARKHEALHDSLICSSCGLEYRTFRETGLLGCPECYEIFRFPLGAYLQKEQGAESHWDGMSGTFSELGVAGVRSGVIFKDKEKDERQENIRRLRSELSEAISREEYERAAELKEMLAPLLLLNDDEENND
ncbi:MAG: UvrB/UvrC motif-containing protein [Synergistaceae bacterium]|jgi:protein arginine kinase activator|nr:UvrB/UvrC motif-containing protein [Synergistaceae bacterium]